jgi:signal transduction histidine kinase
MPTAWWRRAIERRLEMLAGFGLLLCLGGVAIMGAGTVDRMARAMTSERTARAVRIAIRVERAVEDGLRELDLAAAGQEPDDTRFDAIIRLAADGTTLWTHARMASAIVGGHTLTTEGRWHAKPTDLIRTTAGYRIFLVLPARESDPAGGGLAAAINPAESELTTILASYRDEPYRVELRDGRGQIIAASRSAIDEDDAMLAASAGVAGTSWSVRLAQPRREALAPILALQRLLIGGAVCSLALAVLFAWGAARSIRQPVLRLTRAAERLAGGELQQPIRQTGEDEIGRLSLTLEKLRQALEGDERRSRLLKRIISAQEDERRRIARELHDETTQQLTALALQLEMATQAHPSTTNALGGARALVGSMIDDLHRVIYDLRPAMLDDLGLLPAIQWFADRHLASRGVAVHYEFPETMPELAPEARTALYRAAQEAVTNIARHARADSVMIACTVNRESVVIEIEDDGVGFEPLRLSRPLESGEGLGLLGMRERLALLGGTCAVESERGGGTRVIITLPLYA